MKMGRPLWVSQRTPTPLWRGGVWGSQLNAPAGPDFSTAQVGDEIEGGIYAGTITYADSREFHIVAAKQAGEAFGLKWSYPRTTTNATNPDDGFQNTLDIIAGAANTEAASHCIGYEGGANTDWYLPARNELTLLYNNLSDNPEFADNFSSSKYTWSSSEASYSHVWVREFSSGNETGISGFGYKTYTSLYTRPIRRVPV